MGDAGRRTGGSDFEPGTERRRRRFNAGASQFFLQTFETPSCRLNDQRRPRVVPSDKAISLRLSIARGPTLDDPIGMCRRPVPRLPSPLPTKVSQRPVDIPRAHFSNGLSGQLDRRRDSGVRRHAGQPAQLIRAEAQDVMEPGVGTVELQRCVQLALVAQHAGGQLVGEPAIALGEALEVAVTRVCERFAGANFAENLEGRATCVLNPAFPRPEMTAWRLRGGASGRRGKRPGRRSSRDAWRAPSPRDPARPQSRCSSGCRPRLAPL